MTRKSDNKDLKGAKKKQALSRREFGQLVGLAAPGAALLAATSKLSSADVVQGADAAAIAQVPLPPHRPIFVDGIHAYADQLSVTPGATINFYVSSDSPYSMQIYRLGNDPDTPNGDELMPGTFVTTPAKQPIYSGSYVHVANGLPATNNLTALTLECWVRPFVGRPHYDDFNYSGLITQFDYQNAAGYGLFVRYDLNDFSLNADGVHGGRVGFYLGDGGAYNSANLLEVKKDFLGPGPDWSQLQYHHVVATWDGTTQAVWIDGKLEGTRSFTGTVYPGSAPLRLAACGANGQASHFFNGDVTMPVIYNRALSPAEISSRFTQQGLLPPDLNSVLACWPLSEEQGYNVADISPYGRPGLIINHATWQIGGPSFNAAVPQFGPYDPSEDPKRGHGLRFASDDLFDCRWQVTQTYTVPANARSGIYVARLRYPTDTGNYYHVTFIVQKPDGQQRAPILLVCPTNTWLAYNSKPFLKKQYQQGSLFKETYPSTNRRDEFSGVDVPEYSCYLAHQNFAPAYHFGRLLPNPAADPYVTYGSNDYSHLTRATRLTQVWLERNSYAYDVISDLDLHTTPGILKNYKTVIIAGHSEYWTFPAYNGVKSHLTSNGTLIVLSGNTMYWRVSFSPDGTVMEQRKGDGAGQIVPAARRGELWHSDDGRRGGLMRECGFPGWQLTGLETYGIFNVQGGSPGDSAFGAFQVTTPNHFLFQGVTVSPNQPFALNTIGHESDVRVSTLERLRKNALDGVPAGAKAPIEPSGITTLATGSGATFCCFNYDYFIDDLNGKVPVDPDAEMIYWQRQDGGRVFNGGAIGNGIALNYDPVFDGLVRNVLRTFLR